MNFKKLNKSIRNYILACFSLFIIFCLISFYDIITSLFSGREINNFALTVLFKILNHFLTVIFIFILFLPIHYLISLKKPKTGLIITKILFSILVIIELSLTKYSQTTLINLGADLLGYSLDDIFMTVTSSESTSFLYFIPFVIFPLLFLVNCFFLKKSKYFKHSTLLFFLAVTLVFALKFIYDDFSNEKYQNKIYFFVSDVLKYKIEKRKLKTVKLDDNREYPLLKPSSEIPDVLGDYFNVTDNKPNVVVILMEGLGSEFVGDREFSDFSPFLNSLIPKSLFWDNFLSNTGRTFGALPSFTGSLPFGEKGFLEQEDTPSHLSIYSILKKNGYSTSFLSGDLTSFDKKINYLEYNGVETIVDQNHFPNTFEKPVQNASGFSWGYSDYEIFQNALGVTNTINEPRFDVITTQTVHEPFTFPVKDEYLKKVDSIVNNTKDLKVSKKKVALHKDIFASVLYADQSLKMFMNEYAKREDYKNTIFIITGDHRLIPIEQKDKLCRFNVPFYIYSPLLKTTKKMSSISSHFDVAPSLLAFLATNYDVYLPKEVAWLGEGIDTSATFRNVHNIPLMRYKGNINDFVYKDYMYSDGKVFKINKNMNTYKINEPTIKNEIQNKLNEFKQLNAYVVQNNKIYPQNDDVALSGRITFTDAENKALNELTKDQTLDELFLKARSKAFENKRDTAVLICNYILKKAPNYIDVRVLKGRALAWDQKYKESEEELLNALKRSPFYDDIYLALLDMYWWSSQHEKAFDIYKKAKDKAIDNDDIAFKMARAYRTNNDIKDAQKIIDSILKKDPKNTEYTKFKNSLK